MTAWVTPRVENLQASATLALKSTVAQLRRQGRDIVDMSAGEPDMDTPEHVKDGAREALHQGKTKYTDVAGIWELRDAIAEKLKKENGITHAAADTVLVTNGGKQAIMQFFQAVLSEGDEVIIPAPYWVSYPAMVELCAGKAVLAKTFVENNYCLDPAALESCITARTKVLVLNSPSNPSGAGYRLADFQKLEEVLIKHPQVLVLSDEVYEKIVYPGFSFTSCVQAMPRITERIVTVNAFSKSYSMTGWRVGYVQGPKSIISGMTRLQSQSTSNICSIAQYAALAALRGDQGFLAKWCDIFRRRIEIGQEIVNTCGVLELPLRPDGAFYLFIRTEELTQRHGKKLGMSTVGLSNVAGSHSMSIARYLLEKAGVAVVPGVEFGDDNAFRVSVASSEEIVRSGLSRIAESLRALG